MTLRSGPIIRSPFGRVPLPGTAQGNQKRDEFEAKLLSFPDFPPPLLPPHT